MQITVIPRPQFATLCRVFAAPLAGTASNGSPAMPSGDAAAIAIAIGAVDATLQEPLVRIARGSTNSRTRGL